MSKDHQTTTHDAEQNTFSEALQLQIRTVMLRQRMSQAELAGRLGWGQTMVSRRLTGKTPISAEEVVKIARALGVTVVELGFPMLTASGQGGAVMGAHTKRNGAGSARADAVEARNAAELANKDQTRWQLQALEALRMLLHDAFDAALPVLRWSVNSSGCGLTGWAEMHPETDRAAAFATWQDHLTGPGSSPDRTSDRTVSLTGTRRLLAHWESYHPAGARRGIRLTLIADIPAAAIGGEGE